MKPLFLLALLALITACAEDTPPAAEVRDQFQRGFSGQGEFVPLGAPENPPPPEAKSQ
jgi:hypothetical protein